MKTAPLKTPFFWAWEHRPERIGPYECATSQNIGMQAAFAGKSVDDPALDEHIAKHYRWWDGARWSFPLDYDPDLDPGAQEPTEEHYPDPAFYSTESIHRSFCWRGFTEDQDEL